MNSLRQTQHLDRSYRCQTNRIQHHNLGRSLRTFPGHWIRVNQEIKRGYRIYMSVAFGGQTKHSLKKYFLNFEYITYSCKITDTCISASNKPSQDIHTTVQHNTITVK